MPLLLTPPIAALLGVVLALVGRDEVRRTSGPVSGTRGFLVCCLVSLALLAPAVGYFVAFHPDWAYGYFVSGRRVPSAVDLLEVAALTAIPPATFTWAAVSLRRQAVREIVRGASLLVLLLAVSVAAVGPRMMVVGTFEAYREGYDLTPLSGSPLGLAIVWVDGLLTLGVVFAALRLRAMGRV